MRATAVIQPLYELLVSPGNVTLCDAPM